MNTAEQLPVPRAERITHYPNDGHWAIISEGDRRFVADENSLRKIPPETMWGGWTPVAHVLALIESAKLREELAEARKQGTPLTPPALEFIRGCRELLGFVPPDSVNGLDIGLEQIRQWKETHAAPDTGFCDLLGIARGSGWPEAREAVLALQRKKDVDLWTGFFQQAGEIVGIENGEHEDVLARIREIKELSEARLQQVTRLQRQEMELDQPFARLKLTQGNVSQKHEDALMRARVDAQIVKAIAEELKFSSEHAPANFVMAIQLARGTNADGAEALRQLDHLATFIGHPGSTAAHVVTETVSLIEKLVSIIGNLGFDPTGKKVCRFAEEVESRIRAGLSSDNPAWVASEAWKSRALAAESQLAGPPDEKPLLSPGPLGFVASGAFKEAGFVMAPGGIQLAFQEARNWEDSAAQFLRDSEFYQGIIDRIGLLFGEQAFIADDGSRQEGILRLKVPELCERLMLDFRAAEATVAYLRGNRQPVDLKG